MNTNKTGFRWFSNLCIIMLWTKVPSALEAQVNPFATSCAPVVNLSLNSIADQAKCIISLFGIASQELIQYCHLIIKILSYKPNDWLP